MRMRADAQGLKRRGLIAWSRNALGLHLTAILLLAGCQPRAGAPAGAEAMEPPADAVFRPPSAYVASFLHSDSLHWQSINHGGYRLFFREGSNAERALPRLKADLDAAHRRILEVLGIDHYPHGTCLIAVDGKEQMKDLMGYSIKGGAVKGHDLVFFAFNDSIRPQFKHEIFHLMAHEAWGEASHRLLDEGGATYTDGECFVDDPMYAINARFLKEGLLFRLKDLIDDFDSRAAENDVVAYIEAAGIFQYLITEHGREKMRAFWTKGPVAFESIYGFTLEELERRWLARIREVPMPEGLDLEQVLAQGCG